jgi:hypothetical protein
MNMNIQYPISPHPLFVGTEPHQLATRHTNCMQCNATRKFCNIRFEELLSYYHSSHFFFFFHLAPQGEGYLVMRPGGRLERKVMITGVARYGLI